MSITIIIPTLKIDEALERLLEHLPRDVIIVNGGPDTYTFKNRNIINCNPGRGLQLKTGAQFASGEWLFFLHADSELSNGWWDVLDDHMKNEADKALAFSRDCLNIGCAFAVGLSRFHMVIRDCSYPARFMTTLVGIMICPLWKTWIL